MKLEDIRGIDQLFIFKGTHLAGTLTRKTQGATFEYSPEYIERAKEEALLPVAFSMPLETESYETHGDNLHPFFAGLLPEGLRLTTLLSTLKTSADDMFSLLAASGLDVIGDVSAALEPVLEEHQPLEPSELEKTSFVDLFQKSISSTDYAERNTDFSIPGVQPKLSAELVSFPLALKNRKKGYILKFAPKKFPNIVENEHFFMRLAADCGIQTAKTQLVYDRDGVSGLLVERFDRIWDKELKALTRIHQEDSCQFLSRYPQDKYRLSMRQITEGLYQHASSPIIEAARLVELTAFSYLTANGDQHAKNVSLHVEPGSLRIVLTPAYDLVSTLPYGDQTLALTIEGKNSKLRPKDFFTWGGRAGVREPAIRSTLARLAEGIRPATDRLEEIGLEQKRTDFLRKTMLERLEALCDI